MAVDPDLALLVAIAATLKEDYVLVGALDPWAASPFAWIKTRPSRQRGRIGEQLVAGWCAAKGLDVTSTGDSEADRVIGGKRVEIKFSTLWESGVYKFQQLRNQRYDLAICLGISPEEAHCWALPKTLLLEHVIGHTPQHAGRAGSDTYWISIPAKEPLEWMSGYGGTLAQAFESLSRLIST